MFCRLGWIEVTGEGGGLGYKMENKTDGQFKSERKWSEISSPISSPPYPFFALGMKTCPLRRNWFFLPGCVSLCVSSLCSCKFYCTPSCSIGLTAHGLGDILCLCLWQVCIRNSSNTESFVSALFRVSKTSHVSSIPGGVGTQCKALAALLWCYLKQWCSCHYLDWSADGCAGIATDDCHWLLATVAGLFCDGNDLCSTVPVGDATGSGWQRIKVVLFGWWPVDYIIPRILDSAHSVCLFGFV